eukprot:CAMPEP_0170174936 /NCGR_PEP_ID=MMETSP0040_2-20121228/8107_1 /TAXON_ID=641309 /ORGANISM="Lotharella oceanica, Strain CCMP622" /LENGTH=85 /DNA_ID=CAMNT_0010416765 /DNA_START=388 /DNA_END=649 /DNA_ORIENTATION=-
MKVKGMVRASLDNVHHLGKKNLNLSELTSESKRLKVPFDPIPMLTPPGIPGGYIVTPPPPPPEYDAFQLSRLRLTSTPPPLLLQQ